MARNFRRSPEKSASTPFINADYWRSEGMLGNVAGNTAYWRFNQWAIDSTMKSTWTGSISAGDRSFDFKIGQNSIVCVVHLVYRNMSEFGSNKYSNLSDFHDNSYKNQNYATLVKYRHKKLSHNLSTGL